MDCRPTFVELLGRKDRTLTFYRVPGKQRVKKKAVVVLEGTGNNPSVKGLPVLLASE